MDRRNALYSGDGFWISHGLWPLSGFVVALLAIEMLGLDRRIAQAWYHDVTSGWLGSGAGDWWAHRLLHDAGRWWVRGIAAVALLGWLVSLAWRPASGLRRRAAYVFVAMALPVSIVGLLKSVSNVDCPWDLAEFGGRAGYLPRGGCFPGAHAASGYALMCFYFVFRDGPRRLALGLLAAAVLVGLAFSIAQEARGAHFLSHDLTSAALVWFVQLALSRCMLEPGGAVDDRTARPGPVSGSRGPG